MRVLGVTDPRYEGLNKRQKLWLRNAQWRVATSLGWDDPRLEKCGKISRYKSDERICNRPAGQDTTHPGFGWCSRHGGNRRQGELEAAWIMAHKFAQELNCTPWEGLLQAVRIAAGKVAYCEWVLSNALDDRELEGRMMQQTNEDGTIVLQDPDTGELISVGTQPYRDRSWWVVKGELWVDRLARYSKLAIDAGVAEKLVEAQILQAQLMARPLEAALAALELTHEQELTARAAMRHELQSIMLEGAATITGELAQIPNN